MLAATNRKAIRRLVRYRIRKSIRGTAERPRLAVFRSSKHIYAQIIDDTSGRTLAHASTVDAGTRGDSARGSTIETAKAVGAAIAEKSKAAGIETVVFDRGGFLYHGRIKALADAAREGGLQF